MQNQEELLQQLSPEFRQGLHNGLFMSVKFFGVLFTMLLAMGRSEPDMMNAFIGMMLLLASWGLYDNVFRYRFVVAFFCWCVYCSTTMLWIIICSAGAIYYACKGIRACYGVVRFRSLPWEYLE